MSDDTAARRSKVGRLLRDYPDVVRVLIETQVASVTALAKLAPLVTTENAKRLLAEVRGKSVREVELIVVREAPKPPVQAGIRTVFSPAPVLNAAIASSTDESRAPDSGNASAIPFTQSAGFFEGAGRSASLTQQRDPHSAAELPPTKRSIEPRAVDHYAFRANTTGATQTKLCETMDAGGFKNYDTLLPLPLRLQRQPQRALSPHAQAARSPPPFNVRFSSAMADDAVLLGRTVVAKRRASSSSTRTPSSSTGRARKGSLLVARMGHFTWRETSLVRIPVKPPPGSRAHPRQTSAELPRIPAAPPQNLSPKSTGASCRCTQTEQPPMLWRSKNSEPPATPVLVAEAGPSDSSDASVDALGAILAALGEHALPIDGKPLAQIREDFENWRRHLLIGAPHPVDPVLRGRDFVGARRFATQFRREEMSFHKRVGKELRDVLWTLVSQVSSSLTNGNVDNAKGEAQLAVLKAALASGSVDALRTAATQTVQIFSTSIAERRERADEQVGRLREHISSMRDELEQARRALQIDALTKLYNRGAFDLHVVKVAELASLVAEPTALFFIDIDHFKKVNDSHGHQTGDLVLRQIADMCVRCFPRGRDFVARYGGEELVAIAHDVDPSQIPMLAKRTLSAVRNLHTASITGEPLEVSISIGCTLLKPGESCTDWIARADQALYRAKGTGRDRAIFVDASGDHTVT